jgi:predicted nucleic-acid-binding Zn-ribbon protein
MIPLTGDQPMALSTCIKCGGHSYEVHEVEPKGSKFKLYFVQCAKCGGVVGVTDYYNIGALLHVMAKKLGIALPE